MEDSTLGRYSFACERCRKNDRQPIVVQAAAGTVTSFRVPNPGGRAFLRIVVTR